MKKTLSIVVVLAAAANTALADPHKLLVMQTEGRADAATKAKIDASVMKLAKSTDAQVSPGDITFSDAAAAVGCNPDDKACKDEVLSMLAVDELVYAQVTPKPGGLEIAVHRVSKGSATRDAKMMLAQGQSADQLDGVAPLFFGAKTTPELTPDKPVPPTPKSPVPPPPTDQPPVVAVAPISTDPTTPPVPTDPVPPIGPRDEPDQHGSRHRLELIGMAGGGGMVLIGFLLWGSASGIQSDIDTAPNRTHADLVNLANLESRADAYAGWGNVMFIGGLVIGGVSTYYYWKDRKAQRSTTALIMPTVFDHGAGLALTIGGSP